MIAVELLTYSEGIMLCDKIAIKGLVCLFPIIVIVHLTGSVGAVQSLHRCTVRPSVLCAFVGKISFETVSVKVLQL